MQGSSISADEFRELRELLDYVLPTAADLEAFYINNQKQIPQYQRLLSVDDRLKQVNLLILLYDVNTVREWLRAHNKERFDRYISKSTKDPKTKFHSKSNSNTHKKTQKQLKIRSSSPINFLTYSPEARGHATVGPLFQDFVPGIFKGKDHEFILVRDQDYLIIRTYPSLIDCSSRQALRETFQIMLSSRDAGPKFYSYFPFGRSDFLMQYTIRISFDKEAYVIQITSIRSSNEAVVHLLRPTIEKHMASGDCHG